MILPWAFGFYLVGLGVAANGGASLTQMVLLIIGGVVAAVLLRKQKAASVILVLCFLPLGAVFQIINSDINHPDRVGYLYQRYGTDNPLRVYGEVRRSGLDIFNKNAMVVQAYVIYSRGDIEHVNARLLVFIHEKNIRFTEGDNVAFDCVLGDEGSYLNAKPVTKYYPDAWCRAQRGSLEPVESFAGTKMSFYNFKDRLLGNLAYGLEGDYKSLYQGVVFGKEAGDLSRDLHDKFYDAGISHLIVASGAQVALIIFPFFTMYDRMRHRWMRAILFILMAAAMIVLYLVVGHASSILRAISVGYVLLIGRAIGRQAHALNSLAFVGLLWLAISPDLLNDASFLLSYSAAFGILYMAPIIVGWAERRYPRALRGGGIDEPVHRKVFFWVKRNIIHLIIITLSSQWGVMPVIAWLFARISFNGFLANVVAVPAGSIVLILGAISGAVGFIHPVLSTGLNLMAWPFLYTMMRVAEFFGEFDLLTFQRMKPPLIMVIAYYVVTIAVVELLRRGIDVMKMTSRLRKGDLDVMDE
jgi:ComEC/Rec2-related protein